MLLGLWEVFDKTAGILLPCPAIHTHVYSQTYLSPSKEKMLKLAKYFFGGLGVCFRQGTWRTVYTRSIFILADG
jgi:hypothetical protein